jgi:hypothetical protein
LGQPVRLQAFDQGGYSHAISVHAVSLTGSVHQRSSSDPDGQRQVASDQGEHAPSRKPIDLDLEKKRCGASHKLGKACTRGRRGPKWPLTRGMLPELLKEITP